MTFKMEEKLWRRRRKGKEKKVKNRKERTRDDRLSRGRKEVRREVVG